MDVRVCDDPAPWPAGRQVSSIACNVCVHAFEECVAVVAQPRVVDGPDLDMHETCVGTHLSLVMDIVISYTIGSAIYKWILF